MPMDGWDEGGVAHAASRRPSVAGMASFMGASSMRLTAALLTIARPMRELSCDSAELCSAGKFATLRRMHLRCAGAARGPP